MDRMITLTYFFSFALVLIGLIFIAYSVVRKALVFIDRTNLKEYEKHWKEPNQRAEREFVGTKKYVWDSERRKFMEPEPSEEVTKQISVDRVRSSSTVSNIGFQPSKSYSSSSTHDDSGSLITGMILGSAFSSSNKDHCSSSHNSRHNGSSSDYDSSSNSNSNSYDSSSSSDYSSGSDSGGDSSGGGDW